MTHISLVDGSWENGFGLYLLRTEIAGSINRQEIMTESGEMLKSLASLKTGEDTLESVS